MYMLNTSTLMRLQAAISDITNLNESTASEEFQPMIRMLKGLAPGLASVSGSIDRKNLLMKDTLNEAVLSTGGDTATTTTTSINNYLAANGTIDVII